MILIGEPGGIRTHDPKIKSLVLYHLSYGLAGIFERHAGPGVKQDPRDKHGRARAEAHSKSISEAANQVASAATVIFSILSGSDTVPPPPLPRLIWSTNSMPSTTWPQIVY
jgi:hypothetical protein